MSSSKGKGKEVPYRDSFDFSESYELDSELDATEYLQSDPLTGGAGPSNVYTQPRKNCLETCCFGCCGCCFRCFQNRSRRCIGWTLAGVLLLWILIGSGSFVAYSTYRHPPPDGLSPPWYPTPKGGTTKSWANSYKKAKAMVETMTLAEKVNVTTGTGWSMGLAVGNTGPALEAGFPSLALQDGPLGVRFADNITAFPAGITVGATWNRDLMYQWGNAHGQEAHKKGINAILGPSVGPLGRAPAGGRNWEGFGADPYLQGVAASESIKGIQDQGVMATIKHLIGNEQEHFRQSWEWGLSNAMSSNIDDRTMHELYLWPFQDAVKAGVSSVMCSYNMVNSSYACGNSKILNGLLRDELGFQGFVMSDWLAQRSGVASALAGLDMSMPGDGLRWADGKALWGPELTKSVLNASVPLDRLNDMVTRIVAAWYQMGQDNKRKWNQQGPNFSSWTDRKMGVMAPGSPTEQEEVEVNQFVNVMGDHSKLAEKIAIEGTVLLKNDDNLLPLNRSLRANSTDDAQDSAKIPVSIFGEDAGSENDDPNVCDDRACNRGTLAMGWGSGSVEFPYLVTPSEALEREFDDTSVVVSTFATNEPPFSQQPNILRDASICIVFGNSDSGEGYVSWKDVRGDRNDLQLQKGADELIVQVADGCGGDVIVVMHNVGPVTMENWIEHPKIKSVIMANLPGQESGNALAKVIFGDENPSGKLPFTIGKKLRSYGHGGQIMTMPNAVVPQLDFKEKLYTDYRWFDKWDRAPRFEFGYGLSYTNFSISSLVVKQIKPKSALPLARPAPFAEPPEYDMAIPDKEGALFPGEIRQLEKYIYPYVDVDDLKDVSGKGKYPYPEGYDEVQPASAAGGDEGGNPDLWQTYVKVTVDVQNRGDREGQAVPQLYLSYPKDVKVMAADGRPVDFPIRVLRGFEKVNLKPMEKKQVTFSLTRRDLSYWDVIGQNWVMLEEGTYRFAVGQSSRDVAAQGTW